MTHAQSSLEDIESWLNSFLATLPPLIELPKPQGDGVHLERALLLLHRHTPRLGVPICPQVVAPPLLP
ncbi:hypothetical protein [Deinococcus ruber]|uniref:Uncharacterized protein n=1 Tax=Deinococcus ruber TaxID=1848197 RepID=A0A918F6K6_9DEIO|nr:hypothetical protein [Deinococcus ruber]GGR13485.1 hypothetical protein GCM10008957_28050 [Deinococcus ruber]